MTRIVKVTRLFLLAIFGFAFSFFYLGCGPNADGAKLRELEKLENELPIFPSMVETSSHKTSKGGLAVMSRSYSSDAPYEHVKKFYIEELTRQGWIYAGERVIKDWGRDLGGSMLTFRNSEYRLSITYSGEHADYGWDYTVAVVWEE